MCVCVCVRLYVCMCVCVCVCMSLISCGARYILCRGGEGRGEE